MAGRQAGRQAGGKGRRWAPEHCCAATAAVAAVAAAAAAKPSTKQQPVWFQGSGTLSNGCTACPPTGSTTTHMGAFLLQLRLAGQLRIQPGAAPTPAQRILLAAGGQRGAPTEHTVPLIKGLCSSRRTSRSSRTERITRVIVWIAEGQPLGRKAGSVSRQVCECWISSTGTAQAQHRHSTAQPSQPTHR